MKALRLLVPVLVLPLAAHAAESQLEIRLLKFSGAVPSERTLQSLVEDPGAQADAMVSVTLSETSSTEIRQVTPYRFATEYTPKGTPSSFESRDLGWTGNATIASTGQDKINLKLDLSNVRIGTPQIYEVKGIQAPMPTFTAVSISENALTLTRGQWKFMKCGEDTGSFFWAVRVAG